MRVISRLNIGGPAIQAITVTRGLTPYGYDTLLVRGVEGALEGSMDPLAQQVGVRPVRVPALRRELGLHDVVALGTVLRLMYRFRPRVVHTHAAKGGTVGRLAAILLGSAGPEAIVHTFHGHVLEGYFSRPKRAFFAAIERGLAKRTDMLLAVSHQVRDDLVRLKVAPASRISVVPLGFDLSRFQIAGVHRERTRQVWRARHGIEQNAPLVLMVARLVPIKRVDRFLRVATLVARRSDTAFAVLGDGELRRDLMTSEAARALGSRLRWVGFEVDVAPAMFASDVVVLTSDNEGTPVSLIEAHAAGVPAVATDVGGVRAVVQHGESGLVHSADDEGGLAEAIVKLLEDPVTAQRFGSTGRRLVLARFDLGRLLHDLDGLYRDLLSQRGREDAQ
jgi:glycosyltransferase involved in cell wall biosynthesis